ncbi:MAG: tetratricopeptide repeat protein, partial [Methylococcaceae bacterium]
HYLVAERYLDAFLRLFPHHSAALNLMGNIETKTHRLDAAEKSFERALKLEPDATDIRENLEMLRKWRSSTPQDSGKTESP